MLSQLFPSYGIANIRIYYWLGIFLHGWFILPNWVFYFSEHLTIAEIGIIEGVAVLVGILMEVPSGVFADLLGKKKTIITGNLLLILSSYILINSTEFFHFLLGDVIMFIGFSFQSGAIEAFAYDSLKERGRADNYDTVIARHTPITIITTIVSTFIGGYLFKLNPAAPYFAWIVFLVVATLLMLVTTEPAIDTIKFSPKAYLRHLRDGVMTLFSKNLKMYLVPIVAIPLLIKMYEGLVRQSMASYFGYNGETFGYLFALVSIPAILITLGYDRLRKLLGDKKFLLLTLGLYTLGFSIASAGVGLVVGGIVYLIIMVTQGLARPIVSSLINERIDSKHRATTLSTLSLITQIPYIILVTFFASLVEVQNIAYLMFGYALCLALVWSHTATYVKEEKTTN